MYHPSWQMHAQARQHKIFAKKGLYLGTVVDMWERRDGWLLIWTKGPGYTEWKLISISGKIIGRMTNDRQVKINPPKAWANQQIDNYKIENG